MGFLTLDKAVFMDEGLEVGKKTIPSLFFKKTFNFGKRTYAVDLKPLNENGYLITFKKWGLFWNTQYYIYDLNHVFPLRVRNPNYRGVIPPVDTEFLNIQMENKVARDLNRMGDSRLMQFLTTKNVVIGLAILFGAYLLFSGAWRNLNFF